MKITFLARIIIKGIDIYNIYAMLIHEVSIFKNLEKLFEYG